MLGFNASQLRLGSSTAPKQCMLWAWLPNPLGVPHRLYKPNQITTPTATRTTMRSLVPLLFLLLSAIVSTSCALASAPSSRKALGGWTPIKNTNDAHVREIAEFAVAEHNKQANASLALSKVVKGETQVVAGTNYRLVLQVKDASGARVKYQAVVWEKPWENFRQLTSFKLVKS